MDLNIFGTAKAEAPSAPIAEFKTVDEVPAVVEAMARLAARSDELRNAEEELRKSRMVSKRNEAKFADDYNDAVAAADRKVRLATHARDRAREEYETVREQARTVAIAAAWPAYEPAVLELEQALDLAQAKNDRVMELYEAASAMIGGTTSNSIPNLAFIPLNRETRLAPESKIGLWKRYVRSYFTSWAA